MLSLVNCCSHSARGQYHGAIGLFKLCLYFTTFRDCLGYREYDDYQRLKKQYEGEGHAHTQGYERRIPKLQTLDNGSCIILFEHSHSGSLEDTLIGARQELEARCDPVPAAVLAREQSLGDLRLGDDDKVPAGPSGLVEGLTVPVS